MYHKCLLSEITETSGALRKDIIENIGNNILERSSQLEKTLKGRKWTALLKLSPVLASLVLGFLTKKYLRPTIGLQDVIAVTIVLAGIFISCYLILRKERWDEIQEALFGIGSLSDKQIAIILLDPKKIPPHNLEFIYKGVEVFRKLKDKVEGSEMVENLKKGAFKIVNAVNNVVTNLLKTVKTDDSLRYYNALREQLSSIKITDSLSVLSKKLIKVVAIVDDILHHYKDQFIESKVVSRKDKEFIKERGRITGFYEVTRIKKDLRDIDSTSESVLARLSGTLRRTTQKLITFFWDVDKRIPKFGNILLTVVGIAALVFLITILRRKRKESGETIDDTFSSPSFLTMIKSLFSNITSKRKLTASVILLCIGLLAGGALITLVNKRRKNV